MKCNKIKQYFDDYILGELDPIIEIQVNEHFAECERCRKEIEKKEAVIRVFKNAKRFEPSDKTYRRIKAHIITPKKEKRLLWLFPKSFVYAAAAFLLGVILMRSIDILLFQTEESPKVEIRYEAPQKEPFSDTVQFYSAPPKNLARI